MPLLRLLACNFQIFEKEPPKNVLSQRVGSSIEKMNPSLFLRTFVVQSSRCRRTICIPAIATACRGTGTRTRECGNPLLQPHHLALPHTKARDRDGNFPPSVFYFSVSALGSLSCTKKSVIHQCTKVRINLAAYNGYMLLDRKTRDTWKNRGWLAARINGPCLFIILNCYEGGVSV